MSGSMRKIDSKPVGITIFYRLYSTSPPKQIEKRAYNPTISSPTIQADVFAASL